MKTLVIRLLFALGILILLSPGAALAAKSYGADRFDVRIAIQSGGSLQVTETVVFRFAGGPFTYVFRDLPTGYTDGITDLQATFDGSPLPPGTNAGQVEITGTDPIRVRWHFAPTFDSVHAFTLTYRAHGVVRKESDADTLYWNALPGSYEYPIASSTIVVTWGDTSAKLTGLPTVRQGSASVDSSASQATFTARDLKPNAPLQIAVRYAPGSVVTAPPEWQARAAEEQAREVQKEAQQAQWAPFFIAIAALVFVAGAFGLFSYWNRYRRESPVTSHSEFQPSRPPDDLPPAIAGAINGNGPAWPNALATLFDLAQRGMIQIDEIPGKGWFHRRDFTLTLVSEPNDLRPHEQGLLATLFESKKGKQTTVKLSQVSQNMNRQWKKFADPLKLEMQVLQLFDPERQGARRVLNVLSTILILLGGAVFVASLLSIPVLGGWFVIIPLSVVGVAIVGIILAFGLSPQSEQGALRAARWQNFYRYLRYLVSGKVKVLRTDLFERYLPYAASYGMAEEWARYFTKHTAVHIPSWFHAVAGANSVDDDEMGAFVAMMTATSAAGGADGGAAGAGAGAAGGGASGAG